MTTQSETLDRVRRIEIRLTNFIKRMGFAPVDNAKVVTTNNVGVTADGALVVSSPTVPIGDVMFAAAQHRLVGTVDVYVGDRLFGTFDTTRGEADGNVNQ